MPIKKTLCAFFEYYILLTVQCKHWWNSLAVRYSSWIRYTILPQVGEVVWSGQDYTVHLRPSPDLCGHGGTDQYPSRYADHKTANLHVHHHSPVTHACLEIECLDGEKGKTEQWRNNALRPLSAPKVPPQTKTHTEEVEWGLCTASQVLPRTAWRWGSLWWCVCCWYDTRRLPAWVQFCVPFGSYCKWCVWV